MDKRSLPVVQWQILSRINLEAIGSFVESLSVLVEKAGLFDNSLEKENWNMVRRQEDQGTEPIMGGDVSRRVFWGVIGCGLPKYRMFCFRCRY
jgi:hypothetical protein